MTLDFPASRGTFAPLRRDFFVKNRRFDRFFAEKCLRSLLFYGMLCA